MTSGCSIGWLAGRRLQITLALLMAVEQADRAIGANVLGVIAAAR